MKDFILKYSFHVKWQKGNSISCADQKKRQINNTVLTITLALVYYCPNWMYSFYRFLEKIVLLRDRKRTNIHEFGKLLKETFRYFYFPSSLNISKNLLRHLWEILLTKRGENNGNKTLVDIATNMSYVLIYISQS